MANTSQEAAKYEVCFVQVGDSPEESPEILKLAFEAMDSNQLEPTWITTADCLKISKTMPKLFILDPFEGVAFEHLKTFKCRIVGPLCILYCLQYSDILPKRSYPVYSVSMRKITVSCSNIQPKLREEISTQVQLMGGFFSKDLTKSVTHLVVGEVGSQKYKVAANFGLPIMVPEWVADVWENGQYKQLHASDSCYDKFKCPVFKGLFITVSQLSAEERLCIKSIIEENGGSYSGALKASETTHLILSEPTGDKYRFAKNWKVICVNINWIYDSIEAGYCRDETLYGLDESLQTLPKRSTPKKDLTSCDLPLVDCSAIAGHPTVSHLDETMRSDVSLPVSNKRSSYQSLDEFNLSSLPKYGQFLDGCKIFLAGFNAARMDKLRKIVNSGGGMRFSKYSDSISHVVCGELSNDFLLNLRSSSVKPYVVNYKWLLECCKNEKLVDEKPFLCMDVNTLSPEKNEAQEAKKDVSMHASQSSSQMKKENFTHDNITDLFKQYINEQQSEDNKENNGNKSEKLPAGSMLSIKKNHSSSFGLKPNHDLPETGIPVVDLETKADLVQQNAPENKQEDANDAETIDSEHISNSENLFSGFKFVIIGFGEKDSEILSNMIKAHSGVIVREVNSLCDIAVVPLTWHDLKISVSNIVTNCWLQKCIEESRIYDFDENELFRPFSLATDKKPFENFVISFSQYAGTERDCLIHLAENLGATCQEYFVRRANVAKGVLSNTHLVVSTPEGSKYEASKKWKIPAVTKQWVIDAAKMGIAPDIDGYLVDKVPEFSSCEIELKKAQTSSVSSKSDKKQSMSKSGLEKSPQGAETSTFVHLAEPNNQNKCEVDMPSPLRPVVQSESNTKTVEKDKNLSEIQNPVNEVPIVLQHSRITELCIQSHRESMSKSSPVRPGMENSLNASLNLDQTHNFKFQVSSILNDLDASVSRESFGGGKRQSLPVEEMFSRNLASALRRIDDKSISNSQNKEQEKRNREEKSCILSGVVLYVSRKLANIQTELNEIIMNLGGDYLWAYDNTCTHLVFVGKANDITKEFREARAQGKKVVSPEWVYACRDKGIHVEEELYPHTYKPNMTLSQQIAIHKAPTVANKSLKDITENQQQEAANLKSLEATETLPKKGDEVDFNKQLNELLVAAKSAKKRQSKRVCNSVSSSPVNDISPVQKIQRHLSEAFMKRKADENSVEDMPDTCSQHSQSYPITWDDPTGRLEREKIKKLKKSLDNQKSEKNVEVIDLDFVEPPNKVNVITKVRKFMFTNISDSLKSEYMEMVKKLDGEVSDEKAFDITATHLILSNPIKNEKFLSSVASGKWVLNPQYLIASTEQKQFLAEEEYEWGGSCTDKFATDLPASSVKIAKCPYRWRSKLQEGLISSGAFDTWKVVIHADDKTKLATYTKILESGGAEIIPSTDAKSALDRVTHVFVDLKKRSTNKIDLSCYSSHNIKCLKPEYLAFYLIEDPPPDAEMFLVTDTKEQLGASTSSKRRTLSTASTSRQTKKTRMK